LLLTPRAPSRPVGVATRHRHPRCRPGPAGRDRRAGRGSVGLAVPAGVLLVPPLVALAHRLQRAFGLRHRLERSEPVRRPAPVVTRLHAVVPYAPVVAVAASHAYDCASPPAAAPPLRWAVSLTVRTATAPSGYESTTLIPPGSRNSRCSSPDRKSTRLNSSHVKISYAVFCLK